MAEYSFLDLAFDVLSSVLIPLTYAEIWNKGKADGFAGKIRTSGSTMNQNASSAPNTTKFFQAMP